MQDYKPTLIRFIFVPIAVIPPSPMANCRPPGTATCYPTTMTSSLTPISAFSAMSIPNVCFPGNMEWPQMYSGTMGPNVANYFGFCREDEIKRSPSLSGW